MVQFTEIKAKIHTMKNRVTNKKHYTLAKDVSGLQ